MSADDQGTTQIGSTQIKLRADLSLPSLENRSPSVMASGQTLRVEGTNVVRVPFGVRRPRRARPARPERWATVVLPFVAGGSTPPPPQAA